ncbi:hypothetical protein DEO72_LG4g1202 [Vigna unguiculata]|uniref:NAC domain-containing protein n=1 Tax=Vigna unguiculata TaxID=3917 RepID=A0A4D6LNX0_VIGUN|nr:hypothetical protein DEO72_LG4g1202 [Vigna unguiculata]
MEWLCTYSHVEASMNSNYVAQEWPGLPKGVKFDPSDQEIIWHLLAKVGVEGSIPHPFIDEFITSLEEDDGICYTHPKNLPGIKKDGSASFFFHRAIKAYNTGNRKRRKIASQDFGDARWHKTGKTKPVVLDGARKGWKKIMVLYENNIGGGKVEKTNWVMHEYHLGAKEDENDGEYIFSKVFYQQQVKLGDKDDQDVTEATESTEATIVKVVPNTPKLVTLDPPSSKRHCADLDQVQETHNSLQLSEMDCLHEIEDDCQELATESQSDEGVENKESNAEEGQKWWDSESQNMLSSQQLVEALTLCDDILYSQSPSRDGKHEDHKGQPGLGVYADLGPECLKKDIEECQRLVLDPSNIVNDNPAEIRLSQLEFSSQDSFISWGYKAVN